jgi:hypothetical protein
VSIDSLIYLLGIYWPYMAGALVIGLIAGWFSVARQKG